MPILFEPRQQTNTGNHRFETKDMVVDNPEARREVEPQDDVNRIVEACDKQTSHADDRERPRDPMQPDGSDRTLDGQRTDQQCDRMPTEDHIPTRDSTGERIHIVDEEIADTLMVRIGQVRDGHRRTADQQQRPPDEEQSTDERQTAAVDEYHTRRERDQ